MNQSIIRHIFNFSSFLLFVGLFIGEPSSVEAGTIPSRNSGRSRPSEPSKGSINVAGLEVLRTYVCPPCANAVRRQINPDDAGEVTVSIPMGEIAELWQELQWILEQLGVILEAEGLLSITPTGSSLATMALSFITSIPQITLSPSAVINIGNTLSNDQVAASRPLGSPSLTSTMSVPPTIESFSVTTTDSLEPEPFLSTDSKFGTPMGTLQTAAASSQGSLVYPSTSFVETATSQQTGQTVDTASLADMTLAHSESACLATETVDETTTISPTTAANTVTGNTGITPTSVNAGIFVVTSTGSTIQTSVGPSSSTDILPSPEASTSTGTFTSIGLPSVTGSPSSNEPLSYTFDSQSKQNVAVYFGQSPVTGGTTLEAQCADPDVDIVLLAFVITKNYSGNYPLVNFGAACGGQTAEMIAQAPGLLSCPEVESHIDACQQTYGKKVILSIGGASSSLSFTSAMDASEFATTLWNLFGPPGNIDTGLRPFGSASVDGFDIDNEDNMPAYFIDFGSSLRSNFDADPSKTYYLSSAPQCPFPDASDPSDLLLLCDFVYVQFYNNPPCEIGSAGFTASLLQWSSALEASARDPKPRLYLGAPAWSLAGPGAYAHIGSAEGMQAVAKEVQDLALPNFGGVMFWDGPEGMLNTEDGKDILGWAKAGLDQ